jgi:hypothetical protein
MPGRPIGLRMLTTGWACTVKMLFELNKRKIDIGVVPTFGAGTARAVRSPAVPGRVCSDPRGRTAFSAAVVAVWASQWAGGRMPARRLRGVTAHARPRRRAADPHAGPRAKVRALAERGCLLCAHVCTCVPVFSRRCSPLLPYPLRQDRYSGGGQGCVAGADRCVRAPPSTPTDDTHVCVAREQTEGFRGFFRGSLPRLIKRPLSSGIVWWAARATESLHVRHLTEPPSLLRAQDGVRIPQQERDLIETIMHRVNVSVMMYIRTPTNVHTHTALIREAKLSAARAQFSDTG